MNLASDTISKLTHALEEAVAGLEFAAARIGQHGPVGEFMPTHLLALQIAREALGSDDTTYLKPKKQDDIHNDTTLLNFMIEHELAVGWNREGDMATILEEQDDVPIPQMRNCGVLTLRSKGYGDPRAELSALLDSRMKGRSVPIGHASSVRRQYPNAVFDQDISVLAYTGRKTDLKRVTLEHVPTGVTYHATASTYREASTQAYNGLLTGLADKGWHLLPTWYLCEPDDNNKLAYLKSTKLVEAVTEDAVQENTDKRLLKALKQLNRIAAIRGLNPKEKP